MSNSLERFGKERREVGREESRRMTGQQLTLMIKRREHRGRRESLVYCRFTVSYDAGWNCNGKTLSRGVGMRHTKAPPDIGDLTVLCRKKWMRGSPHSSAGYLTITSGWSNMHVISSPLDWKYSLKNPPKSIFLYFVEDKNIQSQIESNV